jgi:hypothetical protein
LSQDDTRSSSEVIDNVICSRRKLTVAPSPSRLNEDGEQAGPSGHLDISGLIANHP